VVINRHVVTALSSNSPPSHSFNVWCDLVEDKLIRPFLPEGYMQQVAPCMCYRTSDFFWQKILPGIILNAWLEGDNPPSHFGRRVTEFLRQYYGSWISSWGSHTGHPVYQTWHPLISVLVVREVHGISEEIADTSYIIWQRVREGTAS